MVRRKQGPQGSVRRRAGHGSRNTVERHRKRWRKHASTLASRAIATRTVVRRCRYLGGTAGVIVVPVVIRTGDRNREILLDRIVAVLRRRTMT